MSSLFKNLGPGLLYAGAAIGVSHLVQSTRAGANYGLVLIIAVVLIHILKYGFFRAGALIPLKSGKDLVAAYSNHSKWALAIFAIITFGTMHIVIAAICIVTAGLVANLFGLENTNWVNPILLVLAGILVASSNTKKLSDYLKWVVLLLGIATLICFFLKLDKLADLLPTFSLSQFNFSHHQDLAFLIAFLGWMPAPMDITLWQSIWITRSNDEKSERQQFQDFNIGYWGTAIMAVLFIALGAATLFQTNVELPTSAVGFTAAFLKMYASTLGSWSYPIIAFAAVATMVSTLITCLDAYPTSAERSLQEFQAPQWLTNKKLWVVFNALGAWFVLFSFGDSLKSLVDFATTLSFLLAPFLAYYNLKILTQYDNRTWIKVVSYLGLLVLLLLASYSIWT
ncbi:NRAMP family divalent metal transporter [Luteibaculum oceani]|uniref:Divalent metal cation transporter n=1 Tax=Luteibaculum oceani TaxID=1294296 RepID=A0A5C6VKD6_9FLAO|nr:divalent metal cation transporter [Luteibaculum oceani]TXC85131.1 divalent metal cation transporter [Luteibaculum oceani]